MLRTMIQFSKKKNMCTRLKTTKLRTILNKQECWLVEATIVMNRKIGKLVMNRKIGKFPFVYLDLSIGGILVAYLFGNYWLIVFEKSYRTGRVKIFSWVVDLFSLNLSCGPFRFIRFPSSKLSHKYNFFLESLFTSFIWGKWGSSQNTLGGWWDNVV